MPTIEDLALRVGVFTSHLGIRPELASYRGALSHEVVGPDGAPLRMLTANGGRPLDMGPLSLRDTYVSGWFPYTVTPAELATSPLNPELFYARSCDRRPVTEAARVGIPQAARRALKRWVVGSGRVQQSIEFAREAHRGVEGVLCGDWLSIFAYQSAMTRATRPGHPTGIRMLAFEARLPEARDGAPKGSLGAVVIGVAVGNAFSIDVMARDPEIGSGAGTAILGVLVDRMRRTSGMIDWQLPNTYCVERWGAQELSPFTFAARWAEAVRSPERPLAEVGGWAVGGPFGRPSSGEGTLPPLTLR